MSRKSGIVVLLLIVGVLVSAQVAGEQTESSNLLNNPGFERPEGREGVMPEGWFVFSEKRADIGMVMGQGVEGSQCVKMGSIGLPRSFQGIAQPVPVEEGGRYTLSALVINNRSDALQGSAFGQMVVEWKDENGAEIDRVWGGTWKNSLSKLRWEKVSMRRVQAPKHATSAVIGIHMHEGDRGGKGSFLVDDVSFVQE